MTQTGYQQITRRRRTIAGSSELWLGADHLLLVVRHWWTERYHRFRLADIQSIVISERRSLFTLQVAGLAITATLLLAVFIPPIGWKTLAALPLGLALIWQSVDVLLGRYCRVQLNTAVSSIRLASLSRLRGAHDFLERITPALTQAQGGLVSQPPPLPAYEGQLVQAHSDVSAIPPSLPTARPSVLPLILSGCMLVLGCLSLALLWRYLPNDFANLSWMLAFAVIVLAGIVTFAGHETNAAIRATAIMMGLAGIVDVAVSFVVLVQAFARAAGGAALDPNARSAWMDRWGPLIACVEIALGAAGFVAAVLTQRKTSADT